MEIKAKNKAVQISPRKVRLVANTLKGLLATEALKRLDVVGKRAARDIQKTIRSAIANAVNNTKLKEEQLVISRVEVSEGSSLKRFHPSTRGRVHPYKKRTSHITVILNEKGENPKH